MADALQSPSTRRAVDAAALARTRRRLAAAESPPWLHVEVARRMVDRLPIFRRPAERILDWYGLDAASAPLLRNACPGASLQPIDPDGAVSPERRPPWWSLRRWQGGRTAVPASTLGPDAGDLLWANMGLHWCSDPLTEMRRWQSALSVGGVLLFSTFGPDTLASLRALYLARGWPPPAAPFVDMHDLGDMLVEAGFAEPVMDQETLSLNWPDAPSMLRELRSLGGNVDPGRWPGLRTPRWYRTLIEVLTPPDGQRPTLSFEIVYGHAMRVQTRVPVSEETRIGLDAMRSILRR